MPPVLHATADVADAAAEVLDRVGGGERALEAAREAEAHHCERLVEPLAERCGRTRVLVLETAGQVLELALGRLRVAVLVRLQRSGSVQRSGNVPPFLQAYEITADSP